jgi:hypothetical protein
MFRSILSDLHVKRLLQKCAERMDAFPTAHPGYVGAALCGRPFANSLFKRKEGVKHLPCFIRSFRASAVYFMTSVPIKHLKASGTFTLPSPFW